MKIFAISDTHGISDYDTIKSQVKGADLLLIAGDTVDLSIQRSMLWSEDWYRETFIPCLERLDCKEIIMVGGNHDFWLEKNADKFKEMIKGTNISYLENEYKTVEIGGQQINVYGTPLCHKFFNWAFMPSDEEQEKIFKETMDDRHIDIFLSHDAPYGCSDICFESHYDNSSHIGNHVLRKVVLDKKPDYFIHGHLHSANHKEEMLGSTRVYNVSLLNEDYTSVYEPLKFEI